MAARKAKPSNSQPPNKRQRQAEINAILGASGSGKTSYVMGELKRDRPSRLIVWDTKREFANEGYATPVSDLAGVVRAVRGAGPSGAFRIAYHPEGTPAQIKKAFDLVAMLAFHAKNLTLVAEELSDVCLGGSSDSAGWRKCITQGRTEGLTIYALSQRPALMDKTTISNASLIRCGRLNSKADARIMADMLLCEPSELIELPELAFIQRSRDGISRGKLTF